MDSEKIAKQIADFQAMALANMYRQFPMAMQQNNMAATAQIDVSSDDEADDMDKEELRTLFCANFDDRVTEELLYELFVQAGPIEKVRIPKDNSGRQRSFGFVTYVHKCTIPYAMRLYKGVQLFRKSLTIKFLNSTNLPPMERILLPVSPDISERRQNYELAQMRNNNRCGYYDEAAQMSAALLRCGADDWMKGSAGRIVIKEPPQKHGSYVRSQNHNTPYQRHDNSNRNRNQNSNIRNNRRSEQRHSGGSSGRR